MSAPKVIAGRYELLDLIGEGGMGSVYRARDRNLDRIVAVKLIRTEIAGSEELMRRFHREALAAARLRSPHIATIHDYGIDSGAAYIVQDFIQGPSLQALSEQGSMEPARAVRLLLQACDALDRVHSAGMIHRDIKPSNFLVEQDLDGSERLVLLDFGIAKLRESAADQGDAKTMSGVILGTPLYMAPEQLRDASAIDPRADLYALGAVTFELLCGRPPYSGHAMDVMRAIVVQPVPRPREHGARISAALEAVILRCLEKDPTARFPGARDLRDALLHTPEGGGQAGPIISASPQAGPVLAPPGDPLASVPAAASTAMGTTGAGIHIPEKGQESAPSLLHIVHIVHIVGVAAGAVARLLWWPLSMLMEPLRRLRERLAPADLRPRDPVLPRIPQADSIPPLVAPKTILLSGPPGQLSLHTPTAQPAMSTQWRALPADSELRAYVAAAGLVITQDQGDFLTLEIGTARGLPAGRYLALHMASAESEPGRIMSTMAYQPAAVRLESLAGTPAAPCYVLVVDERPPGIGVYRHWHSLAAQRHVYVLSARPQALRAAVRAGEAASHLRALLAQSRSDPFALEGPIDDEVEFFGGSAVIRDILDDIRGRRGGIGVFGLDKWGTTSLLRRVRAELLMGGHHPLAWVDLHSLPEVTELALCRTLGAGLQAMIVARQPRGATAPGGEASTSADVLALCRACAHAGFPEPPILILDRVDALLSPMRCTPQAARQILQALHRWAMPGQGGPHDSARPIVIIGGAHDAVVSSRLLRIGDTDIESPLWRAFEVHYTPLFTEAETSEFMSQATARAGMELTPEALAAVKELTGGHKYLCRLVGSSVRARVGRRPDTAQIAPDLVRDAANRVLVTAHDYFAALIDRAPPATRGMLARLAEGACRDTELLQLDRLGASSPRNLPPARELLGALQFALRHHLVRDEGGVFHLAIPLLGQWLRLVGVAGPAASAHEPLPSAHERPLQIAQGTLIGPAVAEGEAMELRHIMVSAFSSDELALLLSDLGLSIDQVTSPAKALELQVLEIVSYFQRRLRLTELRAEVRKKRPSIFEAPPGS